MTADRWFYAIWIPTCAVAAGLFLASIVNLITEIQG